MPAISQITLDHPVTMADGVAYGLVVARPTEITAILPLETVVGTSRVVTLSTPIDDTDPSAPVAGDHVSVGVLGLETLRCLVESIEPANGDTAQLTLIPEAPAVHTAGDTLPDFEAGVTPQAALDPPIVLAVSSDEASIIRSQNGDIQARVVFDLAPTSVDGVSLMVLYRPANTDGNWSTATVQDQSARQASIIGLALGETYDFRVIYTHPSYFASPASAVYGHTVLGDADPPSGLQDLEINAVGGLALLRWRLAPEVDVRLGGWIQFRHSAEIDPDVATWSSSVSIGKTVDGGEQHVWLALKPGTYLALPYDSGGRPAETVAKISSKQATVLTFSPVLEVVEHPTFAGTKTNIIIDTAALVLAAGDFDTVPDVDAITDWDTAGNGVVPLGTYDFAAGMDFTTVKKVRLTSHIVMQTENPYSMIDGTDDWDSDEDVDGVTGAPVDAWVETQQTDDDPGGTPTWGPWTRVDASELECRGILARLIMTTDDPSFNIRLTELSVAADEVV